MLKGGCDTFHAKVSSMDADADRVVVTRMRAATSTRSEKLPSEATEPALNPYQPTHRMSTPRAENVIECPTKSRVRHPSANRGVPACRS
eukprot:743972-Pyramimonas_sp.AAC.1